jgi:hypothetical protein
MGFRIATRRFPKWTPFVAGLWSHRAALFAGLVFALLLPGCSELAQPADAIAAAPPEQPAYVSLAAQYLRSTFKDRTAYDAFEISGLRWVDANKGWSWVACVHFHEQGTLRSYAVFIQDNTVIDARYAVETDNCAAQNYTQFDVVTGILGRPTAPVQPALY